MSNRALRERPISMTNNSRSLKIYTTKHTWRYDGTVHCHSDHGGRIFPTMKGSSIFLSGLRAISLTFPRFIDQHIHNAANSLLSFSEIIFSRHVSE